MAENDAHALYIARRIVANLNRVKPVTLRLADAEEPLYDPEEIYGILPSDTRKPYDVREIIARIVDGSEFDEFKARYGTTLVTGFAPAKVNLHLHVTGRRPDGYHLLQTVFQLLDRGDEVRVRLRTDGRIVRLRYAGYLQCDEVVRAADGTMNPSRARVDHAIDSGREGWDARSIEVAEVEFVE